MLFNKKTAFTTTALALVFIMSGTGCSKHESEEQGKFKTEEIAAKQGEAARAASPAPAAKDAATTTATAAPATATATASSATTTTTTTTKTTTTTSAPANTANATAKPAGDTGEKLYATTCKTCHETGLAGAPKIGDKAAWKDRIAQGTDTLHKHAIAGFTGKTGAMPPKGGSTAPDDEVKAAVDYMVSKAK